MAFLIETAEQHLALQLGNLTAQNIALSCAVEQRDKALGDVRQALAEAQKELADLKAVVAAAEQAPAGAVEKAA